MKVHIGIVILIILAILALWYYQYKDKTCFYLPSETNPEKFGPYFWKAFHDLANEIPCGTCKAGGVELISFVHDIVNNKLGKDLYDKENFKKWQENISKIEVK